MKDLNLVVLWFFAFGLGILVGGPMVTTSIVGDCEKLGKFRTYTKVFICQEEPKK
jgi:hypothetical protein